MKGSPSRQQRSRRNQPMPLRCKLGHTNSPDRKNIAAMKKLSLNSTTPSKPRNDCLSV